MNLKYYYWYFQNALSNEICDKIIELGNSKKEEIGITGNFRERELSKKDTKELKKTRNSNVTWLNDQWLYDLIYPYIHTANKSAGWDFDFNYSESCQFTKYKLNQHYHWHCDSFKEPYNMPNNFNMHNKIRKLSVTCSLSNPKDYKGGELQFDTKENPPNKKNSIITCKEISPRGSLVVFPSFVWHRVKPVTKGIRYSLVLWNLGYPFK
jgi:PKHD-type hydroxylase